MRFPGEFAIREYVGRSCGPDFGMKRVRSVARTRSRPAVGISCTEYKAKVAADIFFENHGHLWRATVTFEGFSRNLKMSAGHL
jgi:hypothetical protein